MGLLNLRLLGRGVDTELFSPDRRSDDYARLGVLAQKDPVAIYEPDAAEKNLPLAIEAMSRMQKVNPRVKGVFVGDGPERENMIRRHPEFIFAGMRRDEDLATHYASADIFVFPSSTETFGNVVTEAHGQRPRDHYFQLRSPQALYPPRRKRPQGRSRWVMSPHSSKPVRMRLPNRSNGTHGAQRRVLRAWTSAGATLSKGL